MASVSSRTKADGTVSWRVQFRIDGQMCQETFSTQKAAKDFSKIVDAVGGREARKVLDLRQDTSEGMPTFKEWTLQYLDPSSGVLTGVEDRTRQDYKRIIDANIMDFFGEMPLDKITKQDVGKWVAWIERQPSKRNAGETLSPKTVHNYHAILSAIFKAAIDHGVVTFNPAYKTKLSKGRSREGVFLSREEFSTLLHFIRDDFKPFILFLAGTGCRWGEATAVTWADINFDAKPVTVRIDKAWKKSFDGTPVLKHPKSSRAYRTISLFPELVEALGTPGKGDELIFSNPKTKTHLWAGRFKTTVWDRAVEKAMDPLACKEHNLKPLSRKPTVHDLRHTHASWLVASGAPLPFVQARLGHESITTTIGVYGHLLPDAHIQMADMMQDTMSVALPIIQQIEK